MKRVKWGVIGAGGIANRRTIPGMLLAKNAELISVMEVNMELAESLRSKHSAKRAFDNVDDLLKDSEIDAVYIASPVVYHKEQAIKAARAKKHILLEKPVALSTQEAKEIKKVCEEEGVLIAAGFMMRFHAYHQKMKQIVESGKLGDVVSCRGQLTCWFPHTPVNWRHNFSSAGGGALLDMGLHCIDLIQYIINGKTKKVAAFIDTKTFNYEVEDSAAVLLEVDNGAYGYVDVNFNIPDAASRCRLEIYGTKGSLLAEGTVSQVEGGKLEAVFLDDNMKYDPNQEREDIKPVKIIAEFGNLYTKEIESFSNSILYGSKIEVPIDDAIQVQQVAEYAYKSSKTGKFYAVE